jgi:hypothetical protein
VGGVPDVRSAEHGMSQAPDCDHTPSTGELDEKCPPTVDLDTRRAPIRVRTAGQMRMRRHQVPEKDVLLEAQVGEDAMDDGRGGLAGSATRQLTLGCERDAADARAAIAGRLADQKETGGTSDLEVTLQALSSDVGALAVTVEIERVANVSVGQAGDEVADRAHRA